jgi:hypothetical protein
MATISNTPRPGYVWDATDNVWYPIGVGGHGHSDYITQATAVNPTIIDAKGDILTATAADTPARLAVGNNGESLVADSSTSTGLRYNSNFAAGKNKIINGDFFVNQRGFTSESNGTNYVADRWKYAASTTGTASINVFTPGTAPVAGYEGKNYLRMVTSGQSGTTAQAQFATRVEDVRTFAGQTTTLSFWAKASSGTPYVAADFLQLFGTGGSSAVVGTGQKTAITTSWARYSFIFAIDSVAGKTISTSNDSSVQIEIWTSAGSDYNARTASMGIQSATIEIWGVQWEAGSVATAFQTATGTIQGELAACQRYYFRNGTGAGYQPMGFGLASSSTNGMIMINFPVPMRISPASIDFSTLQVNDTTVGTAVSAVAYSGSEYGTMSAVINATTSGMTTFRPVKLIANNSATGYLGFSAEL